MNDHERLQLLPILWGTRCHGLRLLPQLWGQACRVDFLRGNLLQQDVDVESWDQVFTLLTGSANFMLLRLRLEEGFGIDQFTFSVRDEKGRMLAEHTYSCW